jgi:dienelactone hydrolase
MRQAMDMRRVITAIALVVGLSIVLGAQTKPPITVADYGQWETLAAGGARGGLSPNGQWFAYTISRGNRNNELRIEKLSDGATKTIPLGTQSVFSSDSKWAAYTIGHSEAEQTRATTAGTPLENKIGLMNLATNEMTTVDGIESFTFSPDGAYLAMRHYPPSSGGNAAAGAAGRGGGAPGGRGGGGRGGGGGAEDAVGSTLIIRQLATGRDTAIGNVSEVAWQDAEHSHLLAMTISAEGKVGNGIQLFDPDTNVLRVLESTTAAYTGLTWRKDTTDLAVLRAKTDDRHDGATYAILLWPSLGTVVTYDPTLDTSFPIGMHTVSFRRVSWSDDGKTIFLGVAPWDERAPTGRGASAGRSGSDGDATDADHDEQGRGSTAAAAADEPAGVDIWHWTDVDVMSKQKLSAAADRRRNLLAAWHLDTGKLERLSTSYTEQVTPVRHTNLAYVAEWSAYAMNRTIGRPAADLYVENIATAERTKLKADVNDRDAQVSPGGKYILFLQDDQFWTIDLNTKAIKNITKSAGTSFIDKESDETVTQKPAFGVGGWTKDDAAVLLYDKYDIWQVQADGSRAQRLTDGATDQVRHRLVRLDQTDEFVDLNKPTFVGLLGLVSKKSGYGRLKSGPPGGPESTAGPARSTGSGQVDRLVWLDKSIDRLAKAKDADVFVYAAQDYSDSPNFFIGGPTLDHPKQVTSTNAFQASYAWGHSELVSYENSKHLKLQGALYYPAAYEPGKKYPMVVYMYEKLSDNVHRYVVPSDVSYYNTSVFTSRGYFVFEPDIVFQARQPGLSVVDCVTSGVKAVVVRGLVDPQHVGVVGHSWGGFDAAFLATHTTGVFAAAVAGAPITDLVSNYGNGHWSSGIAETDHIETGQQRMEVPLYDDLPDYVANSAVFNVQNMSVPLLLECGDADGTVFWHQSVELYNIARRAKKNVVMLVYNGEDHSLRQKKNQVDYQQRILAWFGYYLSGDTPQTWITTGESFLDRQAEVARATAGRGGGH